MTAPSRTRRAFLLFPVVVNNALRRLATRLLLQTLDLDAGREQSLLA